MATHLKVLHKKSGICGAPDPYTKVLFDVSCPECIERVIKKRLLELSFLDKALNAKKAVNQISKINLSEVMIRSIKQ